MPTKYWDYKYGVVYEQIMMNFIAQRYICKPACVCSVPLSCV